MNPFLIISCAEVTSGVFRIHLNSHSWYKKKKNLCICIIKKIHLFFLFNI
jgi:hypothetical protein